MTTVLNLKTGMVTNYTLSPFEAVRAAYAQFEKRDFNTWTYDRYSSLVRISDFARKDVSMVSCGDQCCICPIGKEKEYLLNDYELER